METRFSNSLIIRQVKKEKITTVKGVQIRYPVLMSIDFKVILLLCRSLVFILIEKIYLKHSRQCLISYPKTSKLVKNTPLRIVFFNSPAFRCLHIIMRQSLVFEIYYITKYFFSKYCFQRTRRRRTYMKWVSWASCGIN